MNNLINNDYIVISSTDLVRIIEATINKVKDNGQVKNPTPVVKTEEIKEAKPVEKVKEYMSVAEVSKFINMSAPTIYNYAKNDKIPYHRRGKKLIFKKQEIEDWLEQK